MRYYKIENIVNRSTHPDKVREYRARSGAIDIGKVESVSSIYLAMDPHTDKVHHELHVESRPPTGEYFAFNDTDKYGNYKTNDQLPLFHSREMPGTFDIDIAFGSEKGRTHSMLMAATAKARGEEFVGPTELRPSTDLSEHSLQVVKGLQKRGKLPRSNYPSSPTNSVDFIDEDSLHSILDYVDPHSPDPDEIKIVPAEDLKRGKNELRRFLGRLPKTTPPVNADQFPQSAPTLF